MNKETLRMQMLAGLITESQYKTKLKKFTILENKFKAATSRLMLNENNDIIDIYGEIQAAEAEFEGALMTGDYIEEDYLQELLDASDEELEDLDGGYYDIARILSDLNGNEKKKAIKNIKKWARIELDHFI
jgi:hypothetical protein